MIDIDFYEIQRIGKHFIDTIPFSYIPRIGENIAIVDNDDNVKMFTCEMVLSCFDSKSKTMSSHIKVYLRATVSRI